MLGLLFSLNPNIAPPRPQKGFAWAQPHYLQARNGLCQQHAVCPMSSLRVQKFSAFSFMEQNISLRAPASLGLIVVAATQVVPAQPHIHPYWYH